MSTNNIVANVETKFLCRHRQIRKLSHFLKLNDIHNIILNGPKSTGKTCITKMLLDQFEYIYLWFDMINLDNSNRFFYDKILQQFKDYLNEKFSNTDNDGDDDDDSEFVSKKCLNPIQFIDYMIKLLQIYRQKTSLHDNNKIIIVIDNADILIEENNENLIYLLNNLDQLTGHICPITVIWIFKHHLERLFRLTTDFKMNALQISFEPYEQEELFQLLTQSSLLPKNDTHKLYRTFVNLILKTLTPFENDFPNLNFICHKYFEKYTTPLNDDEIALYNKSGHLYVKFQPYLQEIMDQISGMVINGLNKNVRQFIESMSPSLCYTYVSAYLATYNSTKTDIRFFVRNQRNNRSKKSMNIKDNEIKCPKWFELERSYHIYRAIIDLNEKDYDLRMNLLINDDCEFLRQMANLYDSKILSSKSTQQQWSCSGDSKFQLSQVITDDMILDISSKIDLDINAFLVHRIERSNKQIQL
ncbi:origin recognition complex subunit 5-like protein [Dermatophagoides farinae]|uniref:Origin recognition complex subunit 5-like protein n=1 Tax=Dermatophagoides farinae TaxID=6954 RepID=A0A9D4SLG3_DERFA|nr:origin recognition complex subunit 5-like [Dermatophagoides farinae]KAH7645460.1 origin recognition complex subunit 5-like protein [Dermatophagoides farinae]